MVYVEFVATEMRFPPCGVRARIFFYSLIAHFDFSLLSES